MKLEGKKDTRVDSTGFQVDKNVIYYGNTAINTNNISLISVSPIPMNNSWIGAMVLGLIGISIMKYGGWVLLIAAVVWAAIVVNYNKNRGEFLAISLNSGNTLYFHCQNTDFLYQVISLMVECINTGMGEYYISLDKCIINSGSMGSVGIN